MHYFNVFLLTLLGITQTALTVDCQNEPLVSLDLSNDNLRHEMYFSGTDATIELRNLEKSTAYQVFVASEEGCQRSVSWKNDEYEQAITLVAEGKVEVVKIKQSAAGCTAPFYISVSAQKNEEPGTSGLHMPGIAAFPNDPSFLIEQVLIGGGCFDVENVTAIGSGAGIGQFVGGGSTIGFEDGVILSTGSVSNAIGPNNSGSAGNGVGGDSDSDLAMMASGPINDAQGIEFDFTPTISTISFNFVFASEEYCEFVNSSFNDVFGFFISGPGIGGTQNIAVLPGGGPASINNVNHLINTSYFVPNSNSCNGQTNMTDIQFDGWTTPLTAVANVIPCETYHIKLVIADVQDDIYDSAVFLQANSFSAGGNISGEAVSLTTGYNVVYENCNDATITFIRTGDLSAPLTISWTIDPLSTATEGQDFSPLPTSVTIPAGSSIATLPINIINDLIIEGSEFLVFNVDNACSCTASMLELEIVDPPEIEVEMEDVELCGGGDAILIPEIYSELPIIGYDWNPTGVDVGNGIFVAPTETTTYSLTVTDQCGGVDTASAVVIVSPETNAFISGGGSLCEDSGDTVQLVVDLIGTPPWFLDYSISGIMQPTVEIFESPYVIIAEEAGIYQLEFLESANCFGTALGAVVINETFIFSTAEASPATCGQSNGSVDLTPLGGDAPYTILWSNGSEEEDLDDVPPGDYEVTVTDAGGCSGTVTVTVEDVPNEPEMSAETTSAICGLANGGIDLTVTGNAAPYSFLWNNDSTDEDLTDITPGDYTVTVTGMDGCPGTFSVTVPNENTDIQIMSEVQPNTTCPPASGNGSITLSFTPSTAPGGGTYDIMWSNAGTGLSQSNLPPGSYTVTVSAGGECSETATIEVPDMPELPAFTFATTPEICGLENGEIELTITAGAAPVEIMWQDASTENPLTGLSGGSYAVTVTAANGCTANGSIEVAEESINIDVSGTPTANTSCDVNNGSIDLTVTAASSYNVVWSNGATTEDLTNLAGGTYAVTVSAGGECSTVASFTVPSTTIDPMLVETITPSTCGESNGGLSLEVTGGVGPYTFLWSNGVESNELIDVLADNYSVTVTGSNGCVTIANFDVPDNPIQLTINGTPSANTSCDVNNGAIDISVSPLGDYTYVWSNGAGTEDLTGLPSGDYTVTVFEGATCQAEASFVVDNDTNAPDLSADISPATCGEPDGDIDLMPSGGAMPYSIIWSDGTMEEDLSDVLPDDYGVTITGADGCSNTANYTVPDEPILFTLSGSATPNTFCVNENGAVDLEILPSGTYDIEWSNGEMSQSLSGLSANTYIVTVSAGGTCVLMDTFLVEDQLPVVTLSGVETNIECFGQNTGEIDVTAQGGVMPYVYEWSPTTPDNPEDPTELFAGDYSLLVTDVSGCTASADFSLTQPADGTQAACAQSTNVSIPGAMDGAAAIDIIGGMPPYTIDWAMMGGQSGTETLNAAGSLTIENLALGLYDVNILDANGCPTSCDFLISTSNCPTTLGQMPNNLLALCGTGCLTANYDDFGQYLEPDDLFEYVLHTGSSAIIVGEIARSDEPTFCFDANLMSYDVTYYISAVAGNDDGTGQVDLDDECTQVTVGTPIEFSEQPVAALAQPAALTCEQTSVVLSGTSSLSNSNFIWSASGGGVISGSSSSANITAASAGDYQLIITSPSGFCADTVSIVVEDLSTDIVVDVVASPNEILDCIVSLISLEGSATGSSNLVFEWSDMNGVISNGSTINVGDGGMYQFVATDPLTSCADTTLIEIQDNTAFPPLFTDTAPVLNCVDSTGVISGGSIIDNVEFVWATIVAGDTTIIGEGTEFPVSQPGVYWLLATADNGCENGISVSVTGDFIEPSANAGDDQTLDCFLNPVDLSGGSSTPNVVFDWSSAQPTADIPSPALPVISVSEPGVYTLTVTQLDNGCTATDEVVVGLFENEPVGILDLIQPRCFGEPNGAITIENDPEYGPYQYTLNGVPNGSSNVFAPLATGTYLIEVMDAQGCTWDTEVFLPQPDSMTVSLGTNLTVGLGGELLVDLGDEVTLNAQYNVPTSQLDTMLWTPSELLPCPEMPCDIQQVSPTQQGTYAVSVIDTNGCEAADIVQLFVKKTRSVYVPNAFSPNGDGNNDRFVIYGSREVEKVKSFLVFSRWGETVYEYYNFAPNNPAYGWDGTHRGSDLDPAVFVWFAVVEFIDGKEQMFEGDVILAK